MAMLHMDMDIPTSDTTILVRDLLMLMPTMPDIPLLMPHIPMLMPDTTDTPMLPMFPSDPPPVWTPSPRDLIP